MYTHRCYTVSCYLIMFMDFYCDFLFLLAVCQVKSMVMCLSINLELLKVKQY